jgi:hypothetical protein
MGNPDADLARTVSPYEWRRDQDDDDGNDSRIDALRNAIRSLARRVSQIEQTLDTLKDGAPGKTPQRQHAPAVPKRRRLAPLPGKQIRRLEGRIIRK